ncbi:hypothetical protein BDV06DRAFT_217071 [Aspergillus oleicola]
MVCLSRKGATDLSESQVSNNSGWAVSSMLLGQTAGVLLSGPLGERRGRKPVILASAILYTIGAILMAANVGSFAEFLVGRVLSGLGSGFGMTLGRSTSLKWRPWRITLVLQLIPSIALFIGYTFFPESPRYLLMRGRAEASRQSLIRLRGGLDETEPYVAREYAELHSMAQVGAESKGGLDALKSLLKQCFQDSAIRHLFVFVLLIQTFFIMSGGNSITYYAPTILESIGLDSSQVLLFTAVYGLIKVVSVFFSAFFLTDRFGLRPLLLIRSTINTACLIYLAAFLGVTNVSGDTSPSPAAWVVIVAICIFAVGYGSGWAPVFSLTTSEICPTHLRGPIVSITFTYQNLLNFGIPRGFPNMTQDMHAYGPFALFASFTVCATVWAFFAFPECKDRSMESVAEIFSLPWYRTGFSKVQERVGLGSDDRDMEKDEAISLHQEDAVEV